jgi:uncharacterized protein YbaP (TraB family)
MPFDLRNPIHWRIRGRAVSFLGSIHFGPADGFLIPLSVTDAFDAADDRFFEVDPASPFPNLKYRSSSSLQDEIGAERAALLRQRLGNPTDFDRLSILGVLGQLAVQPYRERGFQPSAGIDHVLSARARKAGKTVSALETVDAQIRAFSAGPLGELCRALDVLLANPDLASRMANNLLYALQTGNVTVIQELRDFTRTLRPIQARALLDEREERWLRTIVATIESGRSAFFVVGALHLAEHEGIIVRLQQASCEIDRVPA